MADAAECSERMIKDIRRNLRQFGSVHAPPTRIGWRRSITPPMLDALCDRLLERPGLYLDEVAIFLWDEFLILATTSSIRKALVSKGWSIKTARQSATYQIISRLFLKPPISMNSKIFAAVAEHKTHSTPRTEMCPMEPA